MADKFWQDPKLPPVQKLPKKAKKPPSYGGRIFVGLVGLILLFSCVVGIYGAINDKTGAKSPFAALAGLLPAIVMVRYALTGQIKVN
jgi:hypothetical protein